MARFPRQITPLAASLLLALVAGCGAAAHGGDLDGGPTGGRDGGGPDGGNPDGGAACAGRELNGGTLDVDIPAVEVTVAVTVNGAPLDDAAVPRGWLVFSERGGRSQGSIELGMSGATWRLALAPGSYDLRWAAEPGFCGESTPRLPCAGGLVKEAVAVAAGGRIDLDLQRATLAGAVTLNRQPLPPSGERGTLLFRRAGGFVAVAALAPTGAARYHMPLLAGRYDIVYSRGGDLDCAVPAPSGLPCGDLVVAHDVDVRGDLTYDLDVAALPVSLAVTRNGQPLADGAADRGALVLTSPGGQPLRAELATLGPGDLTLTLVPGTYEVEYVPTFGACVSGPTTMPCSGGPLGTLTVAGATQAAFDIPVTAWSGAVTLNGAALPDAAVDRGTLMFTLEGSVGGSGSYFQPLGARGPVKLGMPLFRGRYLVTFYASTAPGACARGAALPCTSGVVARGRDAAGGALDLVTGSVGGVVTIGGQPLPATAGWVRFVNEDGSGISPVAIAADGSYRAALLAGRYAAGFASRLNCDPASGVPCNDGSFVDGVVVTPAGRTLDLTLPAVRLAGAVTLAGAELPSAANVRGGLRFERAGGSAFYWPLGASGAARYQVTLLDGRYVVRYVPNAELCRAAGLPCLETVLFGCP